jgi:hypothetical protein
MKKVLLIAASLCLAAFPTMASTVTLIHTGGGSPGNPYDARPCIFFQVDDHDGAWYAIPDNSLHAMQSFKILEDSILIGGGLPLSFTVGPGVAACNFIAEASDLILGTIH